MKNSLLGLTVDYIFQEKRYILEIGQKKLSKPKHTKEKISVKNNECSLIGLWNNIKLSNKYVIAILEGEKRDTGAKKKKKIKERRATIFQEIQLTPAR